MSDIYTSDLPSMPDIRPSAGMVLKSRDGEELTVQKAAGAYVWLEGRSPSHRRDPNTRVVSRETFTENIASGTWGIDVWV